MTKRLERCPVCEGPLEATVQVYLGDVVLLRTDAEGSIPYVASATQLSKHSLGVDVGFYCANDHGPEIEAKMVELDVWPLHIHLDGGRYAT